MGARQIEGQGQAAHAAARLVELADLDRRHPEAPLGQFPLDPGWAGRGEDGVADDERVGAQRERLGLLDQQRVGDDVEQPAAVLGGDRLEEDDRAVGAEGTEAGVEVVEAVVDEADSTSGRPVAAARAAGASRLERKPQAPTSTSPTQEGVAGLEAALRRAGPGRRVVAGPLRTRWSSARPPAAARGGGRCWVRRRRRTRTRRSS